MGTVTVFDSPGASVTRVQPARRSQDSSESLGSFAYTSAISVPARLPVLRDGEARRFRGGIDTEAGIGVGGVGQPEAEGKKRLLVLRLKPLVADFRAFIVVDRIVRRRGARIDGLPIPVLESCGGSGGMTGCGRSCTLFGNVMASLPDGLTSPTSTLASALCPELPAYHASTTRGNLVDPGHGDGSSGFKHDDGVRIRRRHLLDQGILIVGERKIGQVHTFGFPLIRKDNGEVGVRGEIRGGFEIGSGIEIDFCVAAVFRGELRAARWETRSVPASESRLAREA